MLNIYLDVLMVEFMIHTNNSFPMLNVAICVITVLYKYIQF